MKALIFDIKEFALNDGAGIRTTVFFKGCPLRCMWCHNPEGLSPQKELYVKHNGCLNCGLCRKPCSHEDCKGYGRCLHVCPKNLISVVGREWECDLLAETLLKNADVFGFTGGGITLSGGEPLLQWQFCRQLIGKIKGKAHVAIETSGYATSEVFQTIASLCDFVYMDIKLFDNDLHKRYTGVDNTMILQNASWLKTIRIPHTFRTPLIENITDTSDNLQAIAEFVQGSTWEKLPSNPLAGAKYKNVGRTYPLG